MTIVVVLSQTFLLVDYLYQIFIVTFMIYHSKLSLTMDYSPFSSIHFSCRSRSKHPQSHLSSSCTDDQSEILIDDNSESNSDSCQEADKSSDKLSVRIIKPKYSDPELDVCTECGLLCKSGRRIFGLSAWEAVREMRFRVFCATRLTCSAGELIFLFTSSLCSSVFIVSYLIR